MPNMIDGKRLLTWLKREYQRTAKGRFEQPDDIQMYITGGLIELTFVIYHVEQMVNKGGTDGKKD